MNLIGMFHIAGVFLMLPLVACDPGAISTAPPARCSEPGMQCQLPEGPLGVCERSPCPPGKSAPCFQCISQH